MLPMHFMHQPHLSRHGLELRSQRDFLAFDASKKDGLEQSLGLELHSLHFR